MTSNKPLPTEAEQWAEYKRVKAIYDGQYAAWVNGGKKGNPPPHPVRPHTPGPNW